MNDNLMSNKATVVNSLYPMRAVPSSQQKLTKDASCRTLNLDDEQTTDAPGQNGGNSMTKYIDSKINEM